MARIISSEPALMTSFGTEIDFAMNAGCDSRRGAHRGCFDVGNPGRKSRRARRRALQQPALSQRLVTA
jgi:hypothetical protein